MPAGKTTERTVIRWRPQRDRELLDNLDQYTARQRGHRLRYLARLGLLVEADGASLAGRDYAGNLVRPAHWGSDRLMEPPAEHPDPAPMEPEDDVLDGLAASLLGSIEG